MSENVIFNTALNKALGLCSHREFCILEMRNKIESWGVASDDIDKIIGLLIKDNFINEKRYARAFVRDKFNYNKWGKVKLAAYLRIKNIQGDIIRQALDSIDNEAYVKSLLDLISGHRRFIKAKNHYDLKAKLLRYGLSKGFESNLLYDILNDLED